MLTTTTIINKILKCDDGAIEDIEFEILRPETDAPSLAIHQGGQYTEIYTEDLGTFIVEMMAMIHGTPDLDRTVEEVQAFIRGLEIQAQAQEEAR